MSERVLNRFDPPPAGGPTPPREGEIHVWTVPLDPPAQQVARLEPLLAADERARADRFRFHRHRRRYVVGRGVLRTLLGRYLGHDPAAIVFRYGPNEKPYLDTPRGPAGGPELHFNLSNSSELAVVAVTVATEVGADVERLREMPDALSISERFFSTAERQVLAAVDDAERDRAFFHCWTRKEAYLKAVGTGITVPLDRFDVTLAPGEPPRMLAMEGDAERAASWSLFHLEPAAGYLGAVAIDGGGVGRRRWSLSGWRWEG